MLKTAVQTKTPVKTSDSSRFPVYEEQVIDWNVLPCDGIYKLTGKEENITFSYCRSAYWSCPVKNCIMQLV